MNKSSRHHYIPKFFTKNFTDSDGLLFVYNKIENKILSSKKSPKSVFYEWDRNTSNFSGDKLDNLEDLYSALDSEIAIDVSNVLKTMTISPEELTSIALLACQLKWRVPKIDSEFNRIKEDLSQEDLGIKITVKDKSIPIDQSTIKQIEGSDFFKETKRVLLSILPFLNETKLLEIHNNSFIQSNPLYPSLIGDCPVLEKDNSDIYQIEDFIFPLSSSDTFIYKKGTNKGINSGLFFFHRDLLIIESSSEYVGCKSKEHLEKIVEMYNVVKSENKLEGLSKNIFYYIT